MIILLGIALILEIFEVWFKPQAQIYSNVTGQIDDERYIPVQALQSRLVVESTDMSFSFDADGSLVRISMAENIDFGRDNVPGDATHAAEVKLGKGHLTEKARVS